MNNSYFFRFTSSFVIIVSLLSFTVPVDAQTNWTGLAGTDWSNPGNWDPSLPDSATDVIINGATNNPALDGYGETNNIFMGTTSGATLTINTNNMLAVYGEIYVGQAASTTSSITQSDGYVSCGDVWLGSNIYGQNGAGTYNLSGGQLDLYWQLVVGEQGYGTFNQTGGTVNNYAPFYIGDNYYGHVNGSYPGAGGEYNLSAGVYNGASTSVIGVWGGNGTLSVSGTGVMNETNIDLGYAGYTAGSNSAINLSDSGVLNLAGTLRLSGNAATTGTLTQDGGTLTVPVLDKGPGIGVYNFNGGTLNVSDVRSMDVANNGGTLNVGGSGAITTLTIHDKTNYALGKTATHCCTLGGDEATWGAANGVDGNIYTVTHTDWQESAWWKVDLTGGDTNMAFDEIDITSRYNGYNDYFSNFFVRILDKDGGTVWQQKFIMDTSEYLDAGEVLPIILSSAVAGRYVEIQLDGYALNGGAYLFFSDLAVLHNTLMDYTQQTDGSLGIELDPTSGQCDKMVAGAVTLDGTLNVTSLGGSFSMDQSFDILDWDSLSGAFAAVNLPTLPSPMSWDTSELYTTGTITVVPEPATATLLVLALLGLAAILIRRHR
ncbi:MAG: hypothetical protein JXB10_07600 [Pirellulales bacterium]|nr:hypothetical protein [Pirellulales bacterium]